MLAALLLFPHVSRAQSEISSTSAAPPTPKRNPRVALFPRSEPTPRRGNLRIGGILSVGQRAAGHERLGVTATFKEYLPGMGLFDVAVDGSGGSGLHTGTMFVALEQAPLFGWHWDFVAGDSLVSSNLLGNASTNIATPTFRRAVFA